MGTVGDRNPAQPYTYNTTIISIGVQNHAGFMSSTLPHIWVLGPPAVNFSFPQATVGAPPGRRPSSHPPAYSPPAAVGQTSSRNCSRPIVWGVCIGSRFPIIVLGLSMARNFWSFLVDPKSLRSTFSGLVRVQGPKSGNRRPCFVQVLWVGIRFQGGRVQSSPWSSEVAITARRKCK